MSNLNKALALINTFATGDAAKASELLDENYIQHNLAYGTGRNAFVESVKFLASAPVKTTVDNIPRLKTATKFSCRRSTISPVQASKSRLTFSASTKPEKLPNIGTISLKKHLKIRQAERKSTARPKSKTLTRRNQTENLSKTSCLT